MQLFYQPGIADGLTFLDPDESRHCVKVLRKRIGDRIDITDGKGTIFTAKIIEVDPKRCQFEIESSQLFPDTEFRVNIGIAPTKNLDRMEWFVEKCTEIGIHEISFFISKNSERKQLKTDRLRRKVISAAKQSVKVRVPLIHEALPFTDLLQSIDKNTSKFIAYVDSTNPSTLFDLAVPGKEYFVLIGPEGDFTEEELAFALKIGYKMVSLGPARLRTETAGIVACHTLNLVNSK